MSPPQLGSTSPISAAAGSSRWCPTPEQVMILEELYRSGVRTPNASHIQRITAHLSLYGSIQGKNVFYWFQNHKARDRQKLRRKLVKQVLHQHQNVSTSNNVNISNNSFLLNYFGYAPQLPPHPPPHPFRQEGRLGVLERGSGGASSQVNIVERVESYNNHGYGDMQQQKPMKTLQLFPVTSTNLKEDCNNNYPS